MTRRQWRRRVVLVALAGLAAGLAAVWGVSPANAARAGLYALLAVAVESAVRLASAAVGARPAAPADPAAPSRVDLASVLREPEPPAGTAPERLRELQQATWLGARSLGGWHFRLRPVLRDVADGLLDDRHRVRLDRDPAAAQALLGEHAWDRLRADVAAPADRWAPGMPVPDLEDLVRRIERL